MISNNTTTLLLGLLIAFSTLIIPNIGLGFLGINYEDLPFLLLLSYLLVFYLKTKKNKEDFLKSTRWLILLFLLLVSSVVSAPENIFNSTNLRFILFLLFAYLIFFYSSKVDRKDFLLIPLIVIIPFNFLIFIFKLDFLEGELGWLKSNIVPSTLLNSGRLAGIQGGGPNVLGCLLALCALVCFVLILKSQSSIRYLYAGLFLLSLWLLFFTFSRGSYVSFAISLGLFIYLYVKNVKFVLITSSIVLVIGIIFLYIGNPQIILKESDRSLLSQIAIENLGLYKGVGGGNYLNEIYGEYLLALDPEILDREYGISIDKRLLGIEPPGYEGLANFEISTSGSGYEMLQAAFVTEQCTGNRRSCQHQRVDIETIEKFLTIVKKQDRAEIETISKSSDCFGSYDKESLVTRLEFACLNFSISKSRGETVSGLAEFVDLDNLDHSRYFAMLSKDQLFIQCEVDVLYACPDRLLAIGELAALTENLVLRSKALAIEDFTIYCDGCDLREVKGWLKLEFDKYDGILPRSIFRFYTSTDGVEWSQLGYDHTPGNIVEFTQNSGPIEIGGWADGQSFGNTWLGAEVSSIAINTSQSSEKVDFTIDGLNKEYYVYKPGQLNKYTSKIYFTDYGIELKNPNYYWLNIENKDFQFNQDFEILLELKIPEIIWNEAILVSSSSTFNGQVQSWKWKIDDGRLFFEWTDSNGVYIGQVGDRSLRSGLLFANNSYFYSGNPPSVDVAHLSQLTTAHNGFLTLGVEYGFIFSLILFLYFAYSIKIGVSHGTTESFLFVAAMLLLLVHNFSNDLIYAPDTSIYMWLISSVLYSFQES